MGEELDDVDRGILRRLQVDARNNRPPDIAEHVDVTANTVRSRIERLEDRGVIRGYHPHVDYERAGYPFRVGLRCSAPTVDTRALVEDLLAVEGVVTVTEIISSTQNLAVELVARDADRLPAMVEDIRALGLSITDEWFIRREHPNPAFSFAPDADEE